MTEATFVRILNCAAMRNSCTVDQMLLGSRLPPVGMAKSEAAVAMRACGLSYPEIAAWMRVSHSNVIYWIMRHQQSKG